MNESELKTSTKQRVAIIIIAILMLGSMIAGYVAIVANGSKSSKETSSEITAEKTQEYVDAYKAKLAEFQNITKGDFEKFIGQFSAVGTYDEAAANSSDVAVKDLVEGGGKKLLDGDSNYLAYYVGWCADGTIFDSSLDNTEDPTAFSKALDASQGMIEGWNTGVVGMKLGGVRIITLPGEKAYGSSMEICGGYNKPLRFLVMAVENEGDLKKMSAELDEAYLKVQYANYGIDYDGMFAE